MIGDSATAPRAANCAGFVFDAGAFCLRVLWNADVRRQGVALVKAREATLFAKKKPPNDADFKVKSAALWREIAEPDPTGAQFSRLRYWMRTCVFGLTAAPAASAGSAT